MEQQETAAKMQLVSMSSKLIPGGVVSFKSLEQCASLKAIQQEMGITEVQTLLLLLIKNFCNSMNVVRNMSEDQAIECAVYLHDECRDFTLEDYIIMFTLAKRGKLGKILDHVDIAVIAGIHSEYLAIRQAEFRKIHDERNKWTPPPPDKTVPVEQVSEIVGPYLEKWRQELKEEQLRDAEERRDNIKKYHQMLTQQLESYENRDPQ